MKNAKFLLCMLLALLMGALPVALAEEETAPQTVTVPVYTAYERAEQPGMYLSITLNDDTEYRMTTRLGQIAAANQDRFDDENTAATVIRGWFESTHFNFASMFQVTAASEGAVQISDDYLRMYDFVAISDDEGRVMLYPFQLYSADLYLDVCNDAIPVMQALLDPLLDVAFDSIMGTLEDEDMKTKLEVAYEEMRDSFQVTLEDAQGVLTPQTLLQEGVTLENATNIVSDLTVANLGALQPVKLAAGNGGEAWYKLTLAGDTLSGSKLTSPVPLTEIRNTASDSAILWLNEQGEVIYITCSNPSLSADAAQLDKQLSQWGGTPVQQPAEEEADVSSPAVIWYVIAILVVLAAGAAVWYLLRGKGKGARPRYSSGGAGKAPAQDEEP